MVMPIAWLSEAWARLTGGGEPRVTIDGLKMSRKLMFFSHARAERELGYSARPAEDALRDAVNWFLGRR
jgi:dihydroflavonol-4-reductase